MFFNEKTLTMNGKYRKDFIKSVESVEVMKNVFNTLVVIFVAFFTICTAIPAYSCSKESAGITTGGACTIKELQNLEKAKNPVERLNQEPKGERDLRPVRYTQEITNIKLKECKFGVCLPKSLLGW